MKPKKQYRQGDVLIERVDNIDKKQVMAREDGRVILAHGEVTGHAHAITDKNVTQFSTDESGVTEMEIKKAMALLKHEEHGTIKIPSGNYRVIRQREYSPEAIRNVAD